MISLTDADIARLLVKLDLHARQQEYPPMGLGLYGDGSQLRRAAYALIVQEWVSRLQPETQR